MLFRWILCCFLLTLPMMAEEVPKGNLFTCQQQSSILKNARDIWIYTPFGYKTEGDPYPLLLIFDGQAYVSNLIPTPAILDKLISEKLIPPTVAVFVSSIDQACRNRELPCYTPFIEFLVQELLPLIHKHYNVTDKPEKTIVAGSSYGGLAAVYAGLQHPEIFGNILSQSGAFWWNSDGDPNNSWIIRQFDAAPRLPLRFYLDVGDRETNPAVEGPEVFPSMASVNRNMHAVLQSKGYPVYYAEFKGGHEYECWKEAFPIGLVILMKN